VKTFRLPGSRKTIPPSEKAADSSGVSKDGVPAAIFARIEGLVQGVGFRYNCLYESRRLGLSGWVRNNLDGSVEVWAEGPAAKLDALIAWLRHGPPYARVDRLYYKKRSALGTYRSFSVEG
jgi:acylphosphatase